jgi:hypothetical protein
VQLGRGCVGRWAGGPRGVLEGSFGFEFDWLIQIQIPHSLDQAI